jgi:hypothetical protein
LRGPEGWQMYLAMDKDFVLKASGQPDIAARAERGYWGTEFYLRIKPSDFAKIGEGVPYELVPSNAGPGPKWNVKRGVTIVKDDTATPAQLGPDEQPQRLTITKVSWANSPEMAHWFPNEFGGRGILLMHVDREMTAEELTKFTRAADRTLVLEAEGHPTVPVKASIGCFSSSEHRGVLIRMRQPQYGQLARGVSYRIRPRNGLPGYQWVVAPGVAVHREPRN